MKNTHEKYKEARFLAEESEKDQDTKYHQFDDCGQFEETAWASPKIPYRAVGPFLLNSSTNLTVYDDGLDQLVEETWRLLRDEANQKNKGRFILYTPKLGRRKKSGQ